MNTSFGPWTTAMNTGADVQLSTFWKRRMAMLPVLCESAPRTSRRLYLLLAVAAAATIALPTLSWGPAAKLVTADDKAAAGQGDKKAGDPAGATKTSATPSMVEYLPRPSKDEQKILDALSKPTTVEFLDLPLEDCLTFLKEYHNINVWLDKGKLTDEGVALDQPMTLKLADVSLRSILNLLLEPVQLAYVVEDDVMKITTEEQAKKKLFTRTYPIGDLYQGRVKPEDNSAADKTAPNDTPAVMRPGDLEKAIMKTVEPGSWDETKGPASITYVKESGSLVIRHTWGAHSKIVDLLRNLRQAKGKQTEKKP
jgi:hypothetical protein